MFVSVCAFVNDELAMGMNSWFSSSYDGQTGIPWFGALACAHSKQHPDKVRRESQGVAGGGKAPNSGTPAQLSSEQSQTTQFMLTSNYNLLPPTHGIQQ